MTRLTAPDAMCRGRVFDAEIFELCVGARARDKWLLSRQMAWSMYPAAPLVEP